MRRQLGSAPSNSHRGGPSNRRGAIGGRSKPGGHGPKRRRIPTANSTTQLPESLKNDLMAAATSSSLSESAPAGQSRGSKKKRKAVITESEQNFIESEQKLSSSRFDLRFDKKALTGRKAERKQKRLDKKQRMSDHRQRSSAPVPPAVSAKGSSESKALTNNAAPTSAKKRKAADEAVESTPAAKKVKSVGSTKVKATDPDADRRRMEKLAKSNPGFFRLLQESNLIPANAGGIAATNTLSKEDEEIAYYERKLGINKRKKKGKSSDGDGGGVDSLFDDLGFGKGAGGDIAPIDSVGIDLNEDADELEAWRREKRERKAAKEGKSVTFSADVIEENQKGKNKKKKVTDTDEPIDDDFGIGESEAVDELFSAFDEVDEDEDGDDLENELEFQEDEEDEEAGDKYVNDDDGSSSDDSPDFEIGDEGLEDHRSQEDESESDGETSGLKFEFDGSGDEKDSDDQERQDHKAAKTKDTSPLAGGKYVPPNLRKAPESKSEKYTRLKRLIQGQINRLSDANMETIISAIEECYRNNPRHDVTEIITDLIMSSIGDHANLLDSFVMTHSALLAALHNLTSIDLMAYMVQTAVDQYEIAAKSDSLAEVASKRCINLVTLLCHLYTFDVVACTLIFDIVRDLMARLREQDIEIMLRLLRICGDRIRADDPAALKDIVAALQIRIEEGSETLKSPRAKFLIETIMDLKNNRRSGSRSKGKHGGGADGSSTDIQYTRLRKFIGNLTARRGIVDREALRCSLDDIRSIATKGKWWLVGSAWAGRVANGEVDEAGDGDDVTDMLPSNGVEGSNTNNLLSLANSQRMNTDIRRNIFVALMGAEDCVDAHTRLLRLNLKDKQERDIPRVVIHCALAEKVYNPYYALVASRLCGGTQRMRVTYTFVLWDTLRSLEEENDSKDDSDDEDDNSDVVRRTSHLARLYSSLVIGGSLGLQILKTFEFTSLSPTSTLFAQLLIAHMMTTAGEDDVVAVFRKVAALRDAENLIEGLSFFVKNYVRPLGGEAGPRPRMGGVGGGAGVVAVVGDRWPDVRRLCGRVGRVLDETGGLDL